MSDAYRGLQRQLFYALIAQVRSVDLFFQPWYYGNHEIGMEHLRRGLNEALSVAGPRS